jgi:hypothetical protein
LKFNSGWTLSSPRLSGDYDRVPVVVCVERRRQRDRRQKVHCTVYGAQVSPPLPPELSVRRPRLGSDMAGAVTRGKAVATGRQLLDETFNVRGIGERKAREVLGKDVVENALLELHGEFEDVWIDKGWLYICRTDFARYEGQLEAGLDAVTHVARILRGDRIDEVETQREEKQQARKKSSAASPFNQLLS